MFVGQHCGLLGRRLLFCGGLFACRRVVLLTLVFLAAGFAVSVVRPFLQLLVRVDGLLSFLLVADALFFSPASFIPSFSGRRVLLWAFISARLSPPAEFGFFFFSGLPFGVPFPESMFFLVMLSALFFFFFGVGDRDFFFAPGFGSCPFPSFEGRRLFSFFCVHPPP